MKLSDRTYDILKAIYEILVLLAAFYVDIANIWNLPYGDQVQRTFLAVAAILLGLLKISTAKYHKDLAGIDDIVDDLEGEEYEEESVG
jgi:hypothetical protein